MSDVGSTRSWSGATGGPSRAFEYREGARVFVAEWDPRETGTMIVDRFDRWTDPPESIDGAAKERLLDALWAIAQTAGITAIVDESPALACPLALRWNRGDEGFLLDVHDGGRVDYLELRRALRLSYREQADRLYVAFVKWVDAPRWTEPDAPIAAEHASRIRERIAHANASDLRIGRSLPWKLVVEPAGAYA